MVSIGGVLEVLKERLGFEALEFFEEMIVGGDLAFAAARRQRIVSSSQPCWVAKMGRELTLSSQFVEYESLINHRDGALNPNHLRVVFNPSLA